LEVQRLEEGAAHVLVIIQESEVRSQKSERRAHRVLATKTARTCSSAGTC
jgi:hypothetical protein